MTMILSQVIFSNEPLKGEPKSHPLPTNTIALYSPPPTYKVSPHLLFGIAICWLIWYICPHITKQDLYGSGLQCPFNVQTGFLWCRMVWGQCIATRGQRYCTSELLHVTAALMETLTALIGCHRAANFSPVFLSFDRSSLTLSPSLPCPFVPSSSPPQPSLVLTKSTLVTSVCIHLQ